jgi:hypothetical protein
VVKSRNLDHDLGVWGFPQSLMFYPWYGANVNLDISHGYATSGRSQAFVRINHAISLALTQKSSNAMDSVGETAW